MGLWGYATTRHLLFLAWPWSPQGWRGKRWWTQSSRVVDTVFKAKSWLWSSTCLLPCLHATATCGTGMRYIIRPAIQTYPIQEAWPFISIFHAVISICAKVMRILDAYDDGLSIGGCPLYRVDGRRFHASRHDFIDNALMAAWTFEVW